VHAPDFLPPRQVSENRRGAGAGLSPAASIPGELQSAAQANRLKDATVKRFARDRSANDTTLRLLINGPVVDARRLAK